MLLTLTQMLIQVITILLSLIYMSYFLPMKFLQPLHILIMCRRVLFVILSVLAIILVAQMRSIPIDLQSQIFRATYL